MCSKKKNQTIRLEEEMRDVLEPYTVTYPNEKEINETIYALRPYVPKPNKKKDSITDHLYVLFQQVIPEISIFSKLYWAVSAFLYIIGYLFTLYASQDYLLMLIIITPLPFVFGLFEVFKGREQGVLELEMACKYSAYQVMLARLLIISLYNIGLSFALTLVVSAKLAVPIWEILLIWLTPFTLFAAISLWISARFRHTSFTVLLISCWIIFSLFALSFDAITNISNSILLFRQIFFLILGISLCYLQVRKILLAYQPFNEEDSIGISS